MVVELRYVGSKQEDEKKDKQTFWSQELFLAAFEKLRQSTITRRLFKSVLPSARMEQIGSGEKNCVKFYVEVLNKNCPENEIWFKQDKK
jgi:hypothetical protein